jgi:hypothetical protein
MKNAKEKYSLLKHPSQSVQSRRARSKVSISASPPSSVMMVSMGASEAFPQVVLQFKLLFIECSVWVQYAALCDWFGLDFSWRLQEIIDLRRGLLVLVLDLLELDRSLVVQSLFLEGNSESPLLLLKPVWQNLKFTCKIYQLKISEHIYIIDFC